MNILEKLAKELQERKNFTLEQKKRYLYLRVCQLFSYDTRWHFCKYDLIGKKAAVLKDEILNNKIDLENVSKFNIICKNYSEDIFSVILNELLNCEARIECGDGERHYWIEFEENNQTIKADATLGDLTRAKFGFATYGYKPIKKDKFYKERLKNIDKEIDYIKSDYENAFWIGLMGHSYHQTLQNTGLINPFSFLPEEEQDIISKNIITQEREMQKSSLKQLLKSFPNELQEILHRQDESEENIIIKLEKIKRALSNYNYLALLDKNKYSLKEFEDIKIIVRDFFIKLSLTIPEISLFQDNEKDEWDFINIYPIYLKNYSLYYAIEKKENSYEFNEITERIAKTYVKDLKGINKEFINRNS